MYIRRIYYLYELFAWLFQDADASAALSKYFEQRKQQHHRAGKMLRQFKEAQKKGDRSKGEAAKAMAELKRKKRALAAATVARQQSDAKFKAMKAFDPIMLGQGKPRGGNAGHRKERMDFLERVKAKYPALRPELENNWVEFKRAFEAQNYRIHGFGGNAYGSWFLNEMRVLLTKRQEGSHAALEKWIDLNLERNPAMFKGHIMV